ncbi:hypothetical protein V6Z11_D07G082300 [Gossypium hirsutum]
MKGGDGPLSYAKNSSLQKGVVDATKGMIIHAIANNLDMDKFCSQSSSQTFRIADFGTKTPRKQPWKLTHHLEFQLFFNDHSTNDFNTLFKSIPPSWPYFVAGVPGSFYRRLFPKSSIHIGHSSNALQWLSKVPQEVVDCKSPAYNDGSIYCRGIEKEVTKAYIAQFEKDMESFLNGRGEELVNGGLMVILMGGVPNGIPLSHTAIGKFYDLFGSCLLDLTNKGLVNEEKVKSFNLPLYFPSAKEVKVLIERNGRFSIESMNEITEQLKRGQPLPSAQNCISHVRAGFEGLIKDHFGTEIVDEFFACYAKKHLQSGFVFGDNGVDNTLMFMILKRI